ncbi:MAG: hypothetical protein V1750_09865, partial [Acidobacteriota bacterium]
MSAPAEWEVLVADTITELVVGATTVALYGPTHPRAAGAIEKLVTGLETLLRDEGELTLVLLGEELFVEGRPLTRAARQAPTLIRRLRRRGLEHLTFTRGVAAAELRSFLVELGAGEETALRTRPHIHVGRVEVADSSLGGPDEGGSARPRGRLPGVRDRVTMILEVFEGFAAGRPLAVGALETVAYSLHDRLEEEANPTRHLAPWEGEQRWNAVHAHNVCVLAEGLARLAGAGRPSCIEVGRAALL